MALPFQNCAQEAGVWLLLGDLDSPGQVHMVQQLYPHKHRLRAQGGSLLVRIILPTDHLTVCFLVTHFRRVGGKKYCHREVSVYKVTLSLKNLKIFY